MEISIEVFLPNGCYLGNEENPYLLLVKAVKQSITSIELNFVQGKSYYIVVIPTNDTYMSAWKPQ